MLRTKLYFEVILGIGWLQHLWVYVLASGKETSNCSISIKEACTRGMCHMSRERAAHTGACQHYS